MIQLIHSSPPTHSIGYPLQQAMTPDGLIQTPAEALARSVTRPNMLKRKSRSFELDEAVAKFACLRGVNCLTSTSRRSQMPARVCTVADMGIPEESEEKCRQRSKLSIMQRFPLFHGVNHSVLIALASTCERRVTEPGEFIFKQSQEGGSLLFLCRGKVACYERKVRNVSVDMKDGHGVLGKETLCTLALRGGNLLTDPKRVSCVRTSSVVSLTECEMLVVKAEHLAVGMLRSRRLAENIRSAACSYLRELALAGSSTAKRLHERVTLGNPLTSIQDPSVLRSQVQAQTKQRQLAETLKKKICTIQTANAALAKDRAEGRLSRSPSPSPTACKISPTHSSPLSQPSSQTSALWFGSGINAA